MTRPRVDDRRSDYAPHNWRAMAPIKSVAEWVCFLSAGQHRSSRGTMRCVAMGDIFLWDAERLIADADAYQSEYVTDVFRRGATSTPRAVAVEVIGISLTRGDQSFSPSRLIGKQGKQRGRVSREPAADIGTSRLSYAVGAANSDRTCLARSARWRSRSQS